MTTLTLIFALPLLAAIALAFVPRSFAVVMRAVAVGVTLITMLLAVGLTSPTLGPSSLQWAYGAVAVLALLTAWSQRRVDDRPAPSPLTWKDAS